MMTLNTFASTLREAVNSNPGLVHRGRHLSTTFLLEIGTSPYYVTVTRGRIDDVEEGPALMRAWQFAVGADAIAWRAFWQPEPSPGFHDIFAMTKSGRAVLEGDMRLVMAHLRYLKDVITSPRGRWESADAGV